MNASSTDETDEIVAIRRRNDDENRKYARLIADLTRSFDTTNDHYEIRQVQQQFSIELPLPQPTSKHKLPYGKTISHSID